MLSNNHIASLKLAMLSNDNSVWASKQDSLKLSLRLIGDREWDSNSRYREKTIQGEKTIQIQQGEDNSNLRGQHEQSSKLDYIYNINEPFKRGV